MKHLSWLLGTSFSYRLHHRYVRLSGSTAAMNLHILFCKRESPKLNESVCVYRAEHGCWLELVIKLMSHAISPTQGNR